MKHIIICLGFVLFSQLVLAQIVPTSGIVYVKQGATGNGSSWANATSDLHGAIMCSGVSQVWVAEGTYLPTWQWDIADARAFSFRMKNGVTLYGGFPSSGTPTLANRYPDTYLTILSGDINVSGNLDDNCYHVMLNEDTMLIGNTAVLNGFTIRDGNANGTSGSSHRGGAMYNDQCDPQVLSCRFVSNHGERGGAVYNLECSPYFASTKFIQNEAFETGGAILNSVNSHPEIRACLFISNTAVTYGGAIANVDTCHAQILYCRFEGNSTDEYGGAILNSGFSNPTIKNCIFEDNISSNYGGAILNSASHPKLLNCIFEGNSASAAGGALLNDAGSQASLINCTFYDNNAPMGGGVANNSSNPSITNTIIWDCGTAIANISSTPSVQYSCIEGGYAGIGNISSNPMLEGIADAGFRPTIGSPVIDAGLNDSVPSTLTSDYDNFDRIVGASVDMGAYESRGIIYVNWSAVGNNNGASWGNAFVSLEDAITAASDGNQIWVVEGTYIPSSNHGIGATNLFNHFQVKNGVKMYGGFAGWENFSSERDWTTNVTLLSGALNVSDNAYHVLIVNAGADTSAVIDGFRISSGFAFGTGDFRYGSNLFVKDADVLVENCQIWSGNATYGGNVALVNSNSYFRNCNLSSGYAEREGAAVYMSAGNNYFEGCTFDGNGADETGGAVAAASNAVSIFYACSFTANHAADGYGGAFCNRGGASEIISCHFSGNTSTLGGGAIYSENNLELINVTIANNEHDVAADGTGLFLFGSPVVSIVNSIIYDNLPSGNLSVESGSSTLTVSNSDLDGCGGSGAGWQSGFGTDLGGNIDEDPLFYSWAGQTGIDIASPCVNAGSDQPFVSGVAHDLLLDYQLQERIRGIHVDMGAFEVPFSKLKVVIEPAEAITAGAQWSIDNGATWLNSADSLWLTTETFDVVYKVVAGFDAPADSNIVMDYGLDVQLSGIYIDLISVDEFNDGLKIKVYPNPSAGQVFVEIPDESLQSTIRVFDGSGRQLMQFEAAPLVEIDMSSLPNGVYFLQCDGDVFRMVKL